VKFSEATMANLLVDGSWAGCLARVRDE